MENPIKNPMSAEAVVRRCSSKYVFLKNLKGLQLYQKETPSQVLYCEICEIFKNTFFKGQLRRLHLWVELWSIF